MPLASWDVVVSIESMKVAAVPVDSERVILRALLAPPPPRDEHWWWLREVNHRVAPARAAAAWGGSGTFEVQIETSRQELEASTRRFRDALSAVIAARPERYAADREERDAQIRHHRERQAQSLDADQTIVDRVMEE
jgi:hypothetical protein